MTNVVGSCVVAPKVFGPIVSSDTSELLRPLDTATEATGDTGKRGAGRGGSASGMDIRRLFCVLRTNVEAEAREGGGACMGIDDWSDTEDMGVWVSPPASASSPLHPDSRINSRSSWLKPGLG